jgi:phosphate transport system protein
MSLRAHYEQELSLMREHLMDMAALVERHLELALQALIKQDECIANVVVQDDDKLDDMKVAMENRCVTLIATQQPMASDLRNIFAANEIATDLERMGDYAVDIAEIAIRLKDEKYIKELVIIPEMAKAALAMVRGCIDAYVRRDAELASKICKMDQVVDDLTGDIFAELYAMAQRPAKDIFQMLQFLFVAKYIERIADHATNIGEWVVFNVTGKLVDLND